MFQPSWYQNMNISFNHYQRVPCDLTVREDVGFPHHFLLSRKLNIKFTNFHPKSITLKIHRKGDLERMSCHHSIQSWCFLVCWSCYYTVEVEVCAVHGTVLLFTKQEFPEFLLLILLKGFFWVWFFFLVCVCYQH